MSNPQQLAKVTQFCISNSFKGLSKKINFEINPAKKASPAPVVSTMVDELRTLVVPSIPLINHEIGFPPSVTMTSG